MSSRRIPFGVGNPHHPIFVNKDYRQLDVPRQIEDVPDLRMIMKTDDRFKLHILVDVEQFLPEELNISVDASGMLRIKGTHMERAGDGGMNTCCITRRVNIPPETDLRFAITWISASGLLNIKVPINPSARLTNPCQEVRRFQPRVPISEQDLVRRRLRARALMEHFKNLIMTCPLSPRQQPGPGDHFGLRRRHEDELNDDE